MVWIGNWVTNKEVCCEIVDIVSVSAARKKGSLKFEYATRESTDSFVR